MQTLIVKKIKQLFIFALCFASAVVVAVEKSGDILRYEQFYIAGSPSEETLTAFKKKTGAVIVDLRSINELGNCSEPAVASKLGLQYRKVNFDKAEHISPEVIQGIDKAVIEAGARPVLLFCKTGNRAAAWLAIHLVQTKNKSIDESIRIAKGLGLKPDAEAGVREFLKTSEK